MLLKTLLLLGSLTVANGCVCHERFMHLFGIENAIKEIEKAYRNYDIRDILTEYGFNLVNELKLFGPYAMLTRLGRDEQHDIWNKYVDKLEDRLKQQHKGPVTLGDGQLEDLRGLGTLYQCLFNAKAKCYMNMTSAVAAVEENVIFNAHVSDLLHEFWMVWVEKLHLAPALRRIDEINIFHVCDKFTDQIWERLIEVSDGNPKEIARLNKCQHAVNRPLEARCQKRENTTDDKPCDTMPEILTSRYAGHVDG